MERLNRVEELFHEALALEPHARAGFLATACASEPALRSEVEALIAAHERPGSFIDTPAYRAFDLMDDELSESLIGTTLGRYQVVRLIKKSGMGEVFLARDKHLPRDVALKLLPLVFTGDESRLRRFILEAEAVSSLNHPNIITIHEIGHIEDVHFIATEFVDGPTLREKLSDGPLPVSEAVELAIGVTSALVASHAAGIIHRDIKPENIMIRRDGYVKVLDFGLAKLTEQPDVKVEKGSSRIPMLETDPGTLMGTIGYLSPEQAKALEVDARSDFFSLGVVLYEMIAGQAPFKGDTANDVIGAILSTDPPPLTNFAPDTPAALQQIVDRALSKDKEKRYQQAEELLTDLKAVKSQLEQPHTVIPHGTEPDSFKSSFHKLARWRAMLTVAVTVSALAVGAIFVSRAWRKNSSGEQNLSSMAGKLTGKSVAVLPIKNLTGDEENAYLADGLTESLMTELSTVHGLRVISHNSSFAFKDKEATLREVADRLGVTNLIEGSVRRDGNTIRVETRLINAANGEVVWLGSYERPLEDIITMQDGIACSVASEMQATLCGQKDRVPPRYAKNLKAYRAYMKGRFHWYRRGYDPLIKAIAYFEEALRHDPNYALAFVGLAETYVVLEANSMVLPRTALPKAIANAEKALQLDPNLAGAYTTLGHANVIQHNFAEADPLFQKALTVNPNYATAWHWRANELRVQGRYYEALGTIKKAQELDPLSVPINLTLGNIYFSMRQPERVLAQAQHIFSFSPENRNGYQLLMEGYYLLGRFDEALAAALDVRLWQMQILARAGRREEAMKLLAEQEKSEEAVKHPYDFGIAYALLGDKDQAFAWLEKAYAARQAYLMYIKCEPRFDSLRSDPRYADLLKRLNLAD